MRLYEISDTNDKLGLEIDSLLSEYRSIINSYFQNNKIIYRGLTNPSKLPFFINDGATMNRRAANTSNLVNILSSVLPSWTGWPFRNKSFICSLDKSYASDYGDVHVVIPLENQPIAVSSRMDFWQSLPVGFGGMDIDEFNITLEGILSYIGIELSSIDDSPNLIFESTNKIIKTLKDPIEKDNFLEYIRVKKPMRYDLFKMVLNSLLSEQTSELFFNKVLDPSINNTLYSSINEIKPGNGEVWMSGKVLFINIENLKQIKDKL